MSDDGGAVLPGPETDGPTVQLNPCMSFLTPRGFLEVVLVSGFAVRTKPLARRRGQMG